MSYAYVGCRSTRERNARGKGLKVYEISETTGDWKEIQRKVRHDADVAQR